MIRTKRQSNDQICLRQWVAGDEAAFSELVERYRSLVFGVSQALVGAGAADDVAQAVFLILSQKAARLVNRSEPLSDWLLATSRRVAANYRRAEQRRSMREQKADVGEALTAEKELPTDLVIEAVNGLPPKLREVVVLHHLQGLDRDTVAAQLNCTLDAVNKRLQRALSALRSVMANRGYAVPITVIMAHLGFAQAVVAAPSVAVICASVQQPTTGMVTLTKMGFLPMITLIPPVVMVIAVTVMGFLSIGEPAHARQLQGQEEPVVVRGAEPVFADGHVPAVIGAKEKIYIVQMDLLRHLNIPIVDSELRPSRQLVSLLRLNQEEQDQFTQVLRATREVWRKALYAEMEVVASEEGKTTVIVQPPGDKINAHPLAAREAIADILGAHRNAMFTELLSYRRVITLRLGGWTRGRRGLVNWLTPLDIDHEVKSSLAAFMLPQFLSTCAVNESHIAMRLEIELFPNQQVPEWECKLRQHGPHAEPGIWEQSNFPIDELPKGLREIQKAAKDKTNRG